MDAKLCDLLITNADNMHLNPESRYYICPDDDSTAVMHLLFWDERQKSRSQPV